MEVRGGLRDRHQLLEKIVEQEGKVRYRLTSHCRPVISVNCKLWIKDFDVSVVQYVWHLMRLLFGICPCTDCFPTMGRKASPQYCDQGCHILQMLWPWLCIWTDWVLSHVLSSAHTTVTQGARMHSNDMQPKTAEVNDKNMMHKQRVQSWYDVQCHWLLNFVFNWSSFHSFKIFILVACNWSARVPELPCPGF